MGAYSASSKLIAESKFDFIFFIKSGNPKSGGTDGMK
jgi:hypothetical protein